MKNLFVIGSLIGSTEIQEVQRQQYEFMGEVSSGSFFMTMS